MPPALSRFLPALPPAPPLVLARGEVFFVRRVELSLSEAAGPQITLALEGMAPFPPEQLYFGHVRSADGGAALVFAAFRRRFTAEETETWPGARLVAPEFLPLLAARPGGREGAGDGVVLHVGESRVVALAWRAGFDLPVAVLVREGGEEAADAVFAELCERAGLHRSVDVRRIGGELALAEHADGGVTASAGGEELGPVPPEWVATGDVRDPDFLTDRRRAAVRDLWLWRGLLGAAAVFVLAATLELGGGVLGVLADKREARVAAQADAVRQTETARDLANRISELNERRLMPFEMLAIINPERPDSVVFQRAVTRGLLKLEVEAQAQNAEDVGRYTNALRAQAGVASVNARDIRAREGVTSFILDVEFKPEALRNGGAS